MKNARWVESEMAGILYSACQKPMPQGPSSRFRRKLFHGRGYLAQIGGTSRTAPRKTANGYREGPRGANLRQRPALLSHRELVSGPFCHSKHTEADRSLLARTPEYRTHSLEAQ